MGVIQKPPGSYPKKGLSEDISKWLFWWGTLDDHILKFWGVPIILAKLRDIMQQREISMAG